MLNKSLFKQLRLVEITGKMGFIYVGSLFAFPDLTSDIFIKLALLYGLCLSLGLSIYSLNSYLGYESDTKNKRLSAIQSVSKKSFLNYVIWFSAITIVFLYLFNWEVRISAALMMVTWGIYAIPKVGLKSMPLAGLIVAFFAQMIHFHLGYLLFDTLSSFSVLIAIYFSLLFMGGHALHEVIDYEADKEAEINTSAVFFGAEKMENASIIIFGIAAIYWGVLYFNKTVSYFQLIAYSTAFLVQLVTWLVAGRRKFYYRRLYLVYYFVATVAIIFQYYLI